MRYTNSRKGQTSITHLMNFARPPYTESSYARNTRRYASRGVSSGYQDKARSVY
jgi:hypothetical protein